MFGTLLEPGPGGQVGAGIGLAASTGTVTLIPPTRDVERTGQVEEVDGIRMEFQLTPGSEAPAEMNFLLPDRRVLCVAENATHNLHNVLTPRGAQVRDARAWSRYLGEAIDRFGARTEVMFAGHHWPCWGGERVADFLAKQRDLYGYLHDQTLRLLNKGHVGAEIAERLELPPQLAREWHCRDYYGSLSHNAKAIYQRYMGWFDGNPAHLWQHPPEAGARRYLELAGGAEAALAKAKAAYEAGDYRWVAELVNHVVFAEPDNRGARELQAAALTQLGYGAENATWRNFFLTGAKEVLDGPGDASFEIPLDLISALTLDQLFDGMAIRVDGPRAWDERIAADWAFRDSGERHWTRLENGVLLHGDGARADEPEVTLTLDRPALDEIVAGVADLAELVTSGRLEIGGGGARLGRLLELLDAPDLAFPIVTP
jgi:alkyl sulfatase BDS1-like metallo-beta-lactamase superfamily hydrolase